MSVTARIQHVREVLTGLGERQLTGGARMVSSHTDFDDFSEKTGPGDREPSFSDFSDKE